jgi:hypothetical protein
MFNRCGRVKRLERWKFDKIAEQSCVHRWAVDAGNLGRPALIVAAILSLFSGRLLGLAPHYKLWSFIVGFAFLCSLSAVVRAEPDTWSAGLFICVLPILVVLIYFLPTAAAISVDNPSFQSVFLMNLFFGWTVVGWLAALAWGLRRPPVEAPDYRITPFGAVAARPSDNPRQ